MDNQDLRKKPTALAPASEEACEVSHVKVRHGLWDGDAMVLVFKQNKQTNNKPIKL